MRKYTLLIRADTGYRGQRFFSHRTSFSRHRTSYTQKPFLTQRSMSRSSRSNGNDLGSLFGRDDRNGVGKTVKLGGSNKKASTKHKVCLSPLAQQRRVTLLVSVVPVSAPVAPAYFATAHMSLFRPPPVLATGSSAAEGQSVTATTAAACHSSMLVVLHSAPSLSIHFLTALLPLLASSVPATGSSSPCHSWAWFSMSPLQGTVETCS